MFESIVAFNYQQAELDVMVRRVIESVTAEQTDQLTDELVSAGVWGEMA